MGNAQTKYPITEHDVDNLIQEKEESGEKITDNCIDELMERGYNRQLYVAVKREIDSRLQEKSWSHIIVTDDDIQALIEEKGENISDKDFDDYVQSRYHQFNDENDDLC
ncbi:hypothetical protein CE11_01150 [Megavirus courdo11]|uniref:Uncharacterized protein n=1 Tax=Megavirus courdo11 TaxID=1128140 RepID=K7Z9D0_9VIRU|nr:hypothetical protein CE11_01150 [Megavirus courdo11]